MPAAGTGTNYRQIQIVQGRITDGTLFPNISAKILSKTTRLIARMFDELRGKLDGATKSIGFDLSVGLDAAQKNRVGLSKPEKEHRERLAEAVKTLQRRHKEVLASIRDL